MFEALKSFSAAKGFCDGRPPEVSPDEYLFYLRIEEEDGIKDFMSQVVEASDLAPVAR